MLLDSKELQAKETLKNAAILPSLMGFTYYAGHRTLDKDAWNIQILCIAPIIVRRHYDHHWVLNAFALQNQTTIEFYTTIIHGNHLNRFTIISGERLTIQTTPDALERILNVLDSSELLTHWYFCILKFDFDAIHRAVVKRHGAYAL